jgi:hypothetical protein
MTSLPRSLAVVLLAIVLAGCGGEATSDGASDGETTASTAPEPVFPESVEDQKCGLLTADDVAAAIGVPVAAVSSRVDCLYTWEAGGGAPAGSVFLVSLDVDESVERAQREFARRTEDVTADEVADQQEAFAEAVDERQTEGAVTDTEAATGAALTDALTAESHTHRPLPGVGSEAVVNDRGSAYVRLGNARLRINGMWDGENDLAPEAAAALGRAVVDRLSALH